MRRLRPSCSGGPAGRGLRAPQACGVLDASFWQHSLPPVCSAAPLELFHDPFIAAQIPPACAGLCHTSLGIRAMVHTPSGRYSHAAPAPARFDALCMALGLSDGPSLQTYSAQPPQPPKLRLAPAGGVRKAPQRRSKLAVAAALEHGMATPPRLAEQPHRRQPFAVGRRLQPLPPVWRPQRAAQPAARSTPSSDTVTSPNVRPADLRQGSCYLGSAPGAGLSLRALSGCGGTLPARPSVPVAAGCLPTQCPTIPPCACSGDSRCVTSPAPLSTGAGAAPNSSCSEAGAILATGMRLILSTMSQADACQLAAARSFLAAFPPAC